MANNFLLRYKDTGKAFAGGMGEVKIYDDQHLERKVAIKFIKNERDRDRLIDEIKALQQICSKHVVQIFDIVFCESTQRFGIVQEFVPGPDLDEISESGHIDKDQYLKILYQIASGLTDIHAQGLVHRDVKPNNIKFDGERILKIFDFGLARCVASEASTLGFKGTHFFAAPELYRSGVVFFTEAVDIYAFGIIAWVLSGSKLPPALSSVPPNGYDHSFDFSSVSHNLGNEITELLNLTLSEMPGNRPKMSDITNVFQKYLLRGKHRAVVVSKGTLYNLTEEKRSVTLQAGKLGSISIQYDGLDFKAARVIGNAYINNQNIVEGYILPMSCVITLGDDSQERLFVTFDISNPEVVL